MDNPETHGTLNTRHKAKTNKTQHRKPKGQLRMDNPETHGTLNTRHKAKTNKTCVSGLSILDYRFGFL
jgi:hypothetical protein